MKLTINNKITCQDIPQGLMAEIKNRLNFVNPKWEENEKRGFWQGKTPRILRFYEIDNDNISVPRGFIRQLLSLCRREDVTFHIEDNRRTLPEVDFQFQGTLRPFQEQAVRDVLGHDFGVLHRPAENSEAPSG